MMQNGFNTFGFGPYLNYSGDHGYGGNPFPNEYGNWNTPWSGGYSNGWNTPWFGGYSNGWNTPSYGGYSDGWNAPWFGGDLNGWNSPYFADEANGWNTSFHGGKPFGGFGGYAPNPNTVPGVDPAQNAGGPFWTGSGVTEAA